MTATATINTTVPKFELTITDENFDEGVRLILAQIRTDWIQGDGAKLESKVLTGGITNKIIRFFLRDRPDDAVIFKIYGFGTDALIDREKEIQTMILLSRHQLGSKLYALFTNGIVYEYIPGSVLTMKSCLQPEVYKLVAAKMGRLHSIPLQEAGEFCGGDSKPKPLIWDMLDNFIRLAAEAFQKDPNLEATFQAFGMTLDSARKDAVELRTLCEAESMPVFFTHNDLLLGNIIYNGAGANPDVAFIDFEYGGLNYGPYDVANHFNEFAGVEPDEINYDNYPSSELKSDWIRIYLQNLQMPQTQGSRFFDQTTFDRTTFEKWVTLCTPLSHLTWVVWCIVQASSSKLDFDYVQYSRVRFPEYVKQMQIVRELYGGSKSSTNPNNV